MHRSNRLDVVERSIEMLRRTASLSLLLVFSLTVALQAVSAQPPAAPAAKAKPPAKTKKRPREDGQKRAESLEKIASRLDVESGSVIADIGAGGGRDTWTFAQIVGDAGKVFSVEIDEGKTNKIADEAEKRELKQVKAVLGTPDDPCLSSESVDMAFMHYVYHHVSKPSEMLRAIWHALKPGGYFVVVDQRFGTLQDWVPREDRAKKHYWIAETTVVREARERGYRFVEYAEPLWHAKSSFVLIFQRPADLQSPTRDPDAASEIPRDVLEHLKLPPGNAERRVAFVALGEGRELVGPLLNAMPAQAVDIVLEEWATRKDERPPLPAGVKMPSVLTDKGDPRLTDQVLDAVYFLDTYHLLFHGPTLLAKLRERLGPAGCIFVVDRQSPEAISHREASHRRMIAAATVKQEMAEAGFALLREMPQPAKDRFLLVFGKSTGQEDDSQ
jgi:predicted methyltransferase